MTISKMKKQLTGILLSLISIPLFQQKLFAQEIVLEKESFKVEKIQEQEQEKKENNFLNLVKNVGTFSSIIGSLLNKITKNTDYYSLRTSPDFINSYLKSKYYQNRKSQEELPEFITDEAKRIGKRFAGELVAKLLHNTFMYDWYTTANEKINNLTEKYTYNYESDLIEKFRVGPAVKLEQNFLGVTSSLKIGKFKTSFEVFLDEANINLSLPLKYCRIGAYAFKEFEGDTEYGIIFKFSY